MRRLGFALLASTAFVGVAAAADLPRAAPVYKAPAMIVAPPYNWTGFYVGGNIGYGWGSQDASLDGFGSLGGANVDGIIGGGQIGYNWQMNQLVLGLETDFQGSDQKGDGGVAGTATYTNKLDWFGTLRGRVGYAFDRWLPYVTGGWAYGHGNLSGTSGGVGFSGSNDYSGWTLGGGLEYAFLNNWSAKLEYLYIDFGDGPSATVVPGTNVSAGKLTDNVVRLGVNYKF
ncbi:MAG: outer membrane protein [Pseudolabrys sp.]